MNAPSDDFFWIFIDSTDVMSWHNLKFTRGISSSGHSAALSDPKFRDAYLAGTAIYAPFVPNTRRTSGFVSRFLVNIQAAYEIEYDAEYVRCHHFPTLPSRFS